MRITGGKLRGQEFTQPPTRVVRPISGKVLQALFNMVGPLDGAIVLDTYAGSGAVGFEALSRGAALVEAIEANRSVARVIERNAQGLGLDWGYNLNAMTVETWLAQPSHQDVLPRYNLIVADPPYAQLDEAVLTRLAHHLIPQGILVVSHGSKRPSPVLESVVLVQAKVYGDSALSFYQPA